MELLAIYTLTGEGSTQVIPFLINKGNKILTSESNLLKLSDSNSLEIDVVSSEVESITLLIDNINFYEYSDVIEAKIKLKDLDLELLESISRSELVEYSLLSGNPITKVMEGKGWKFLNSKRGGSSNLTPELVYEGSVSHQSSIYKGMKKLPEEFLDRERLREGDLVISKARYKACATIPLNDCIVISKDGHSYTLPNIYNNNDRSRRKGDGELIVSKMGKLVNKEDALKETSDLINSLPKVHDLNNTRVRVYRGSIIYNEYVLIGNILDRLTDTKGGIRTIQSRFNQLSILEI